MIEQQNKKTEKEITVAVVNIIASFNNTIVTASNARGKTLFWSSAGKQGFRGSKKSSPYSAQVVGEAIANSLASYKIKSIRIKISGPGPGRESAIRALYNSGVKVLTLEDITPIPHNGCKLPKKRRT